jgi:phosphoribosylamine-glycine ligase
VFVLAEKVEMVVVGPEVVKGIYDFLNDEKLSHISVIGPSK